MKRVLEPEVMDTAADAAEYDAMDHAAPNTAFVVRLAELEARGRMLDIGTGPGHIPLLVCARFPGCTVLGVDLSEQMLAIARRRRDESASYKPAGKKNGRIEYKLADAKALDLADGSFDTVYSNTILHHMADPLPFLAEARRVLRPGGVLLIRDLFRPDDAATVDRLVALYAGGCDPHQRELFRASLCAAFSVEELRGLVRQLGWEGVEVVVDTDRHASIQRGRAKGHGPRA